MEADLRCGVWSSHCHGFFCCGAQTLGAWASVVSTCRLVVTAHGLSCSAACGIFLDQESNPCSLHWQEDSYPLYHWRIPRIYFLNTLLYFPGGSDSKASVYNAGELGSIPGSGRFSGEGNGNPLQYSCLENPMDGGAWCPWGLKKLDTTERLHFLSLSTLLSIWCVAWSLGAGIKGRLIHLHGLST